MKDNFLHWNEVESVLFAKPKLGTGFTSKERLKLLVLLMMMKGNRPELKLKRYDYFGYGFASIEHQADVIALSKLICLVLAHENCTLLQPKSIWNADKAQKTCSLVENILHLDPIEVNIFQGITLLDTPQFGQVFGRQLVGQALAAATKTVDCLKLLHSVHAHFLLAGDSNILQKEEGSVHQQATMPSVPVPDTLLSMEELHEKRLLDPHLPRTYQIKAAAMKFVPWLIDQPLRLNPHQGCGFTGRLELMAGYCM
nr:uncharacterized protein LOC114821720 isoform X2 [Malus domestica]